MARYGLDPYYGTEPENVDSSNASTFYGVLPRPFILVEDFRAFVDTTFYNAPLFGTLTISWKPVRGAAAVRLVRNHTDLPVDEDDGENLTPGDDPAASLVVDSRVVPGSFTYYALFVSQEDGDPFLRAATITALPPQDFGYGDYLWRLVPGYLRDMDEGLIDRRRSFTAQRGPLRRMLEIMGWALSSIRTEYETLLYLHDPLKAPAGVLPLLADYVGIPFESELGTRLARRQIAAAVHLNKIKGTEPGVLAFVTALTGWDARITTGTNRALAMDVVGGISLLHATGSATATVALTTAYTSSAPADGPSGSQQAAVRVSLASTDSASVSFGQPGVLGSMIPVVGGEALVVSLQAQAGNTVTGDPTTGGANVLARFYDRSGDVVDNVTGPSITPGVDVWGRSEFAFTVPEGSAFMEVVLAIHDHAANDRFWFAEYQIETGSTATAYTPPRKVLLSLVADRVNFVRNPSFELGTAHWTGDANTTLTQASAALIPGGTKSASMEAVGAGAVRMTHEAVPVVPSATYAVSSFFAEATGTPGLRRSVRVGVRWLDEDDALIGSEVLGATVTEAASAVRASLVAQAPPSAMSAEVFCQALGCAGAGETHLVDGVMLERSLVVRPYLAPDASGNFFWQSGVANDSELHFYDRRAVKQARLLVRLPEYLPAGRDFGLLFAQPVT